MVLQFGTYLPRNEYQESSWEVKGGRRVRLTSPLSLRRLSIKMWKPRRLTTLWASTACNRDSFTFLPRIIVFLAPPSLIMRYKPKNLKDVGIISRSGTCLHTVQWLRTLIQSSISVSYEVWVIVSRPIWSSHAHTRLHQTWLSVYKGKAPGVTHKPASSSPSCIYLKIAWKFKLLYCEFVLYW
jgi:hypothetical protein